VHGDAAHYFCANFGTAEPPPRICSTNYASCFFLQEDGADVHLLRATWNLGLTLRSCSMACLSVGAPGSQKKKFVEVLIPKGRGGGPSARLRTMRPPRLTLTHDNRTKIANKVKHERQPVLPEKPTGSSPNMGDCSDQTRAPTRTTVLDAGPLTNTNRRQQVRLHNTNVQLPQHTTMQKIVQGITVSFVCK
jgi:hypothetical protein